MRCCRPRPRWLDRLALGLVVAGLLAGTQAHARKPVVVTGERITVGDLSPTAPRELWAVDIAPAPRPGARTTITRAAVAEALRRAGAEPELATAMPAKQEVTRAGVTLDEDAMADEIRAAAAAELPVGVTIESIVGARAVTVPAGERTVAIKLGKLRASTRATVAVNAGGKRWATFDVTLGLGGNARTPVLKDELPSGTTIAPDHVEMRTVALGELPEGSITRTDQLVGKRLRAKTSGHAPVRASITEATPIITKGSVVVVVATGKGVRVTRQATAQQDGAEGQVIRVKTTDDDTVLRGKVHASGELRIDLGGGR